MAVAQQVVSDLLTAPEMLVMMNEVTINRSMEPERLAEAFPGPLVIRPEEGEGKSRDAKTGR